MQKSWSGPFPCSGASTFPQQPAYNPTGPVGALAYWSAEAIITRYLKSQGPLVHA